MLKVINQKLNFEVFLKVNQDEELLQEPLSKIPNTESPDSSAFDVEVERVECSLKTPKLTAEIVSTFFIHTDMVDLTNFYLFTYLHSSKSIKLQITNQNRHSTPQYNVLEQNKIN